MAHRLRSAHNWYGTAGITYPPSHCLETWGERHFADEGVGVMMFHHLFGNMNIALLDVNSEASTAESQRTFQWPASQKVLEQNIRDRLRRVDNGNYLDFDELPEVIMSTQDPDTDITAVREALSATFPELLTKVKYSIGGNHFTMAHGAACVARQLALFPEMITDYDRCIQGDCFAHNIDEL